MRARTTISGLGLLIALGILLPAIALAAGTDSGFDVRETLLPNGLKVLTKEIHAAPAVAVWTWYRVGSRNERPGITGISHQVEHMMFKGTASLKPGQIDRLVQFAGGRHNAFTSFDATAYHITLPSEHLETALRIEADRMLNGAMDPQELVREKGVVLSELQGRQNDPEELLEDEVRSVAFRVHPYRWPVIGWKTDVQAFTHEAVQSYYRTYYQPNNAVLVIVGDFQTDALLALVRKYFGQLPAGPPPPPVIPQEPPQKGERRILLKDVGTAAHLQFLYHVPPTRHPDQYPLAVLDAVLTEGKSSRLYRALVETELAATQASYLSRRLDAGWITFYLTARDGVPHERIERAFSEAIERIQAEPVSDFELQKAINQVRASLTFAQGSLSGLAQMIGKMEVTVGHREMETYLERIRQVTVADVQRVARQYLSPDNRTVGWFLPQGPRPGQSGRPSAPRNDIHRAPEPPQMLEIVAGAAGQPTGPVASPGGRVVRTVLANGLTLIAAENRVAPSVAIKGYVLAGPVLDPPGQAGLSYLTAWLLTRGAKAHSASALAEGLDFLGASATVQAEHETVGITAQMLSEHFDKVLDLLAECLRNPTFPGAELAKAMGQLKTTLHREADDPRERAQRELFAQLFPRDHPLHRNPKGQPAELDGIGREDVLRFYDRFYRPDRTVLVIAGDISPEQALASVERAFGGWARSPAAASATRPPMPVVSTTTRHTVVVPGKSEAIVMLGGNGITRDNPDYYPAFLANRVLGGGGLGSRLMKALRERDGMTYGVYSYFHPVLGERPWVVSLQTSPAAVDRAIAGVLAEATRLCDDGVTAEELEGAKASAIGSLALSMQDQTGLAFVFRDTELFNLGLDFPQRFTTAIRTVTPEQVQAAARKYLHPDRLVQVVVTPPQP
ncbi:MAG: insulinase family protein [candidate division NC10 bacterium]|nr:insulinase family protein [candidate division NC10 bacterium]